MSNFILEILEPTLNVLDIENSFNSVSYSLEIINTEKILASDLPDDIPMSKIIGNLNVTRINGLNQYLDTYHFDCGSP